MARSRGRFRRAVPRSREADRPALNGAFAHRRRGLPEQREAAERGHDAGQSPAGGHREQLHASARCELVRAGALLQAERSRRRERVRAARVPDRRADQARADV
uniref:(northern house mosquito) hypothetical protein n=1 Tax=Culex pipiens TaxID=7175 RepID=A0A8D8NVL1_CULPI